MTSASGPDLAAALTRLMPGIRADLERLVRVPSVSADPSAAAEVYRSAQVTVEVLRDSGLADARIVEVEGARPAVLGHHPAPPGAPRVLLYAHHDVQPAGDAALWDTPAFEPTEREGRLHGRGATDDKAGIAAHAAALRAHAGSPPVGVTVFVEGEEEIGSPGLGAFLAAHREELRADVIVLADSGNWAVGQPALTTSLRGLVDCVVEVRTLDHAVHSGMYGGPVIDALTVLCRLLATLHDDAGDVAVRGLGSGPADPLDLTEERLRADAGVSEGVELVGTGALTERMWTRPAVAVLALDAPRVADASNTLVPSARAKVSLRVAPGDDAERAYAALERHLLEHAPWGARVTVVKGDRGQPYAVDASGPAYDAAREAFAEAWGTPPVDIGVGGSIPFVAEFAAAFPDAAILVTGVGDPDSRAHGANESLHLAEFERVCLAEALLLTKLAGAPGSRARGGREGLTAP